MDKLWYILEDNNQFGPFNEQDLQGMFKKQKISRETTLIKRGFSEPILVRDLIKKPRTIVKPKVVPKETPRVIKESFKRATPPPPPKIEKKAPKAKITKPATSKRSIIKPLGLLASFALMCTFFYFGAKTVITNQSFQLERPKDVRPKTFYKAKNQLKNAFDNKDHQWKFIASKDLKNLYLMSSLPGTQSVRAKFTSIENKILGNQPIEFITNIDLKDNLAEIKELNFSKGSEIIPGAYKVELEVLKNNLSPWQKLLLDDYTVKKTASVDLILKFHSKKTYSKELAKFQKLQKRRDNAFVQDIKMKYETLLSIANRISDNLDKAKKGPLSKPQVEFRKNYFLQDYQMKYGTFFSNFVIENEKKFKDLTNSTDELKTGIIAHYSTLSSIARSLGMISIDAIDNFAKLAQNRDIFDPIQKRYEAIITTCKNKIDKLENIDLKQ